MIDTKKVIPIRPFSKHEFTEAPNDLFKGFREKSRKQRMEAFNSFSMVYNFEMLDPERFVVIYTVATGLAESEKFYNIQPLKIQRTKNQIGLKGTGTSIEVTGRTPIGFQKLPGNGQDTFVVFVSLKESDDEEEPDEFYLDFYKIKW